MVFALATDLALLFAMTLAGVVGGSLTMVAESVRGWLSHVLDWFTLVVLRRVHELRADGCLAPQRAAQLAHEPLDGPGGVDVDDLARERRPLAVHAAVQRAGVLAHATPQNGAFEREADQRHGLT